MNSAVAEKTGLEERIKLAEHIADEVEARIITSFHHELKLDSKGKHDFATELDKANETFAQNLVHESFSGDYFFGEEFGGSGTEDSTYEWIVDPLDGTNNYVRGLPLAGFQLAIVNNGEIVHSVVRRPFTQERYYATRGQGAFYENGLTDEKRQIFVSERSLSDTYGIFDSKIGQEQNPSTNLFQRLIDEIAGVRVLGVAVYDLPAVADGSVEFLLSGIAKKYDVAPGWLLVEEAGGEVYNLGNTPNLSDELLIFSNKRVKNELLAIVESVSNE